MFGSLFGFARAMLLFTACALAYCCSALFATSFILFTLMPKMDTNRSMEPPTCDKKLWHSRCDFTRTGAGSPGRGVREQRWEMSVQPLAATAGFALCRSIALNMRRVLSGLSSSINSATSGAPCTAAASTSQACATTSASDNRISITLMVSRTPNMRTKACCKLSLLVAFGPLRRGADSKRAIALKSCIDTSREKPESLGKA
mmetsp:Transcript_94521/g.148796  ORF Transcript_94521/g.148796 Transcript_94521/m.148796 type:complete len:202 (+) Transcript_94521:1956-2561(+)